jgi:hypothetical protein
MVVSSIWGGGVVISMELALSDHYGIRWLLDFWGNLYTMVLTEEEGVVSSNPEILPIVLAEIKFSFQNGIVCNKLNISHV